MVAAAGTAPAQETVEQRDTHHQVDEITVTATPLSRTVEQLAQPTAVLSGDELATKQAASIGETVSGEVGVSSTYFGPVASRPVIRGQFGERVRVLSNGLDTLDASALSDDHQTSLEGILAERVEIVRGPATLLYGSGAAGGLVNVVDRRIAERPLDVAVEGAMAGNLDSAIGEGAGAARVAFGNEHVVLHLDGFRRETDDVEIPGFAESAILRAREHQDGEQGEQAAEVFGEVENTDSETNGGAVGVSWLGDRGFLGVAVSTFDSDYGTPGHVHAHEEEHEEEEPGEEAVRIALDQSRVDLKGSVDFEGPLRAAKIRAAQNDYRHVEFEGGDPGTVFDTSGSDARVELHHRPVARLEGAFGLQYKRIDFAAIGDEAYVPPSDTVRNSVFAFEELRLADHWALQGSARIEHQTIETPASATRYSDNALGASLGSVWNFGNGLDVSINAALTERHPNATELFADGAHVAVQRVERGSITQGLGVLGKETSTNLDVTFRGGLERVEWAVTGWINAVDDYILLQPTAAVRDGLPVFDYRQDDVRLYGVEAETRLELFDSAAGHLHGRLFTDFVHGEVEDSGAYLPRLPPLRVGASLHYTLDRFEAGLDATWHREQDKTAENELPTDGYTLLGAQVSYALPEPSLFLYLRAKNLTDEDARQHTSPLKDTLPLPGRSLHAGFRYDF